MWRRAFTRTRKVLKWPPDSLRGEHWANKPYTHPCACTKSREWAVIYITLSILSLFYDFIPPLVERGLYCNHLVRPFVRLSVRPLVRLSVSPSVHLSVRSHFRNRYLSFYWKKWLHIYLLFTVRLTNERVWVFVARRSVQHLVTIGIWYCFDGVILFFIVFYLL
jgi:hypothetical protein